MINRRFLLVFLAVNCLMATAINNKSDITNIWQYTDVAYATTNDDLDNVCDRSYLIDCEDKDVVSIENKLNELDKLARVQEYMTDDGKIDYKKYFKNTIFIGDSITEYLKNAELMSESNVYAAKGKTVIGTDDDVEKLKYANPERIILLFGMNDVVNFQNSSDYKSNYIKLINNIKKSANNAKIYIESPTQIQEKAERINEGFTNERLREFRNIAKEVADETNSTYIDLTDIVSKNDFFEVDGIHFKYNFYDALFSHLVDIISKEEKL